MNKQINKLIFFGFSFGEQDMQYFNLFDSNIEVDFYINNENDNTGLIERVENRFLNVKFIDANNWKDQF